MHFAKKKSEEGGEQHFGDAGGVKGNNPCFRCGRVKPDCAGARNCKCDKKADGTDVNSQDVIDGLFKSQKEAKRNRRKETTGSQFVMDGVTVPTWSDEIDDEKSHDGNTMVEWECSGDISR